jgi:hypothetical protein
MDFQFVSNVKVDNAALIERSTAVETNPKYVLTTIQIQMFFLASCAKQWTGNLRRLQRNNRRIGYPSKLPTIITITNIRKKNHFVRVNDNIAEN